METTFENHLFSRICVHSDPTYEAWKLDTVNQRAELWKDTPILPMRHGNYLRGAWFSNPG